jgi:DNA primase
MIKTKWIHGRYFDQFPQPGEFNITSLLYNLCNAKHILEEYNQTLILVEGPPDGLRFEQAGIQNWSATFGTKAFGQAQRSLLINHGVNRVLLAYDNDKAGQKGVQRGREQIGNLIHVDLFPLPESKDPGECAAEELKDRYLNVIS